MFKCLPKPEASDKPEALYKSIQKLEAESNGSSDLNGTMEPEQIDKVSREAGRGVTQ